MLAVFSGASLEAVEAVAIECQTSDEYDIFEILTRWWTRVSFDSRTRAMGCLAYECWRRSTNLPTPAWKRMEAFNAAVRRSHTTYFAEFTANQWQGLAGKGQRARADFVDCRLENIRTAWRFWRPKEIWNSWGKSPTVCGCSMMHAAGITPQSN